MKKKVFLEAHNIKNPYFGFGQFNYHLIKGLYNADIEDFKMVIHAKDIYKLKEEFGDYFEYKKYYSFRRYPFFGIREKYNVWHSLNQNIKIEPKSNQPYLLTVHDVNFIEEVSNNPQHPRNLRFQEKLNRSSAITYISEYAKRSTHQYFKVPDIPEFVIYNGNPIQSTELIPDFVPQHYTKHPFLFTIGECTPRKNFHTLVDMLKELPEYDLVISGNQNTDYAKQELTECIKSNNLEKRVILTGKINDIEKQYYLKNCAAFVFPSLREGFGIPPIEAMRFGKPVFLSNNTSLPEIGGKYAFYWDHYKPNYMADVFTKGMLAYQSKKDWYSERYIERAKSFDWNKAAKQYIEVYRSLP
jgi:glycosyltransferase involved in cell wall biosynthesis